MERLAGVAAWGDIAEYDGNNRLLRKYVHGPAVDQPICMIDVNETSYYHYDGLGSVVALSDAAGEAAVLYEYGIYGQAAASDPNHPNPFLFTGREFDKETGLYYYRARYYNPYIGRFLQTDPAGDGMNTYAYCGNSPLCWADPSGLIRVAFYDGADTTESPDPYGWDVANQGDDFRWIADDEYFDFSIDMRGGEFVLYGTVADYIIAKLTELQEKGYKITDVYFFDHGWDGTVDPNTGSAKVGGGFSLGDEWYTTDERTPAGFPLGDGSMENFAKRLGTLLKADAYSINASTPYTGPTIHLRSCFGGQYAERFANWSGLKTTGWTGIVRKGAPGGWPPANPGVPNYHGSGNYVESTPLKGMGNGATSFERSADMWPWY